MVGPEENTRKIEMTHFITNHELARLSLHELQGLYRKVFNDLVQSQPGTPERRNALASLDNIQRELNRRYACQWNGQ